MTGWQHLQNGRSCEVYPQKCSKKGQLMNWQRGHRHLKLTTRLVIEVWWHRGDTAAKKKKTEAGRRPSSEDRKQIWIVWIEYAICIYSHPPASLWSEREHFWENVIRCIHNKRNIRNTLKKLETVISSWGSALFLTYYSVIVIFPLTLAGIMDWKNSM